MKRLLATLALTVAASAVSASGIISYDIDQSFDDVTYELENEILDAGLDGITKAAIGLE